MDIYTQLLLYAVVGFFILIFIEWLASVILKRPVHRFLDSISSLSSGITNTVKDILNLSIIIISYQYSYEYWAVAQLPSNVWVYVLTFVVVDFVSYWSHRWNHRYNILWNRHVVHHSSEEFNLPCALRQSISGIVQIYFFLYLPLAIIGVQPQIIAVVAPLHLFAQFWYHTRLIDKMGILEHFLVTPSHHRVHHAINTEYIDKNFSAIFIIWDKWFGTFQQELEDVPPVYGVKRPVSTWNPITINFMHLWQLIVDAWRTQVWLDKLRIWFMPTGWRPADVLEQYPLVVYEDAALQVKYHTEVSTKLKWWVFLQFIVSNLMLGHLAINASTLEPLDVTLYGLYIFTAIYANSSLMDTSISAFIPEAIKTVFGFGLLIVMDGWFGWNEPLVETIVGLYLLASLMVTLVCCKQFYFKIRIRTLV